MTAAVVGVLLGLVLGYLLGLPRLPRLPRQSTIADTRAPTEVAGTSGEGWHFL